MKPKLLVIVGPTGTGKTDLAIRLAKQLGGELVACDSRQIYLALDIGTGKLPSGQVTFSKGQHHWIVDDIKIWMYDVVNFNHRYTAADYAKEAGSIVKEISDRGVLPIIVGGTGLYLKALLEGLDQSTGEQDSNLRQDLEKMTVEELQQKLATLSPLEFDKLNNSDRQNKRRLVRKIEKAMYPSIDTEKNGISDQFNFMKIGLTEPREYLNKRIDNRLDNHIKEGLVDEAKVLQQQGLSFTRMRELGLEYGILADLLEEKIDFQTFVKTLKTKIHQYAKRQMTWFKNDTDIQWFDISEQNSLEKVVNLCVAWYNS